MNSKAILLLLFIIAYFSHPLMSQDNQSRNALFISAGVTNGSSNNNNTIFGAGYEYRPYPKASFEFTVIFSSTKTHQEFSPNNQIEDEKFQNDYPGINFGAGLKFFLHKNISMSPECRMLWGLGGESKLIASVNLSYHW